MEKPALNSMSCNNCGKKLAELKIDSSCRAENLSPQDYLSIAKLYLNYQS